MSNIRVTPASVVIALVLSETKELSGCGNLLGKATLMGSRDEHPLDMSF